MAGHLARVNKLVAQNRGSNIGLDVHVAERTRGLPQVLAGVHIDD